MTRINQSQLPGKYKVWYYNLTLYVRVVWPLKICEIPSSAASRMDILANSYIQKWLGLPRYFSDTGLFRANSLQLPIQSVTPGCKQEKSRLVLELRESDDPLVRNADGPVLTGRMWQAHTEVNKAISRLQHQEIVGRVQVGRSGLCRGETPCLWSKVN